MDMESPIVVEREYNAPITLVWKAITDLGSMKQWYFDIKEFKLVVGFEFSFVGKTEKGVEYLHKCKILEVRPEQKLTYSWAYDGYAGISFVTFELTKLNLNKTKIKLTHSGIESFPRDSKDFEKKNFVQGWTEIMGTMLKNFLEEKQTVNK